MVMSQRSHPVDFPLGRVPHFSPLLREVGSLHRTGPVLLHARSLVPLVSARDFGMTPLLENFGDRIRAASNNRVGRTFLSDQAPP
jgi:hypothetical protein